MAAIMSEALPIIYTNSAIKAYQLCPRKYHLAYICLWRAATLSKPLAVGSGAHAGLEALWEGGNSSECIAAALEYCRGPEAASFFDANPAEVERVKAMVGAYYDRWADDIKNWDVLAVEVRFNVEIEGVQVSGKWDVVARNKADGRIYVIDHKTAGKVDPARKAQELELDHQVTLYTHAAREIYGEPVAVMWDILKRPSGNPRKSRLRQKKTETAEEFAIRSAGDAETPEQAGIRWFDELCADPDAFARVHYVRTDDEQREMMREALAIIRTIEADTIYPRNVQACGSYSGCEYFGVCTGYERPEERLIQIESAHPELLTDNQTMKGSKNGLPF